MSTCGWSGERRPGVMYYTHRPSLVLTPTAEGDKGDKNGVVFMW